MDRGIGGAEPCAWETRVVTDMRSKAHYIASLHVHRNPYALPVDDLTQLLLIAVVRACRVWARTSADRPPRPYVNVAMANALKCITARRLVRRDVDARLTGQGVAGESLLPSSEERVVSKLTSVEDRLAARSVLALLERSGVDMETLTIWSEGLSAEEAGQKLGVAPATFRNRVCRARKEARAVLDRLAR